MALALDAVWRILRDESGPTAVEYAVLISLVLAVTTAGARSMGINTSSAIGTVGASLSRSGGSSSSSHSARRDSRSAARRVKAAKVEAKHDDL